MSTEIISNGSTWNGQKQKSIPQLIQMLKQYAIEENFFFKKKTIDREDGSFEWVILCPIMKENGVYHFFGNFETYSHVFNIRTTDKKLIHQLKTAIMKNEGWRKYSKNYKVKGQ